MNTVSRRVTGIVGSAVGIILIFAGLQEVSALFYGVPVLVISLFIFFNKREDVIEKIRGE